MIIPLTVSQDAKPGDNLLEKCSFARKCTAILKDDGSVHVTDMRVCEECEFLNEERNSRLAFEFPRYNYDQYNMKDYKYVYGTGVLAESNQKNVGVFSSL